MAAFRKSMFSGSWYPGTEREVNAQISIWDKKLGPVDSRAVGGIVPHAGWFFSGLMAYDVIRRLRENADLVVIVGGHLPSSYPYLHWTCDFCETPCGVLPVHTDLRDRLVDILESKGDDGPDNTIEVQLPLIRSVLGEIPIVPIRAPAGAESLGFAEVLNSYAEKMNLNILTLGSTDLTHYGSNYNFTPAGSEDDPLLWVEDSDKRIIDAMVEMDGKRILSEASLNHSACSAGAAACAAEYAKLQGVDKGKKLSYDTSLSRHEAESFVGYGAVIYES